MLKEFHRSAHTRRGLRFSLETTSISIYKISEEVRDAKGDLPPVPYTLIEYIENDTHIRMVENVSETYEEVLAILSPKPHKVTASA